jgi:hypothetical protein
VQDYVFYWAKENITFEGQTEGEEEGNTNSVRLQIINETIGDYTCYVSNGVQPGGSCTIQIDGRLTLKGYCHEMNICFEGPKNQNTTL